MCSGRVALLGDGSYPRAFPFGLVKVISDLARIFAAAHSMTSFFGQGACQAIEDATELANLLSLYFHKGLSKEGQSETQYDNDTRIPNLLQRYSNARQPRARNIATFSAKYALFHTAQLPYGLGPFIRKLVYSWAPVWFFVWCLRWLYEYQPVVHAVR